MDYFDGELPEPQRRTFERHLDVCDECRRYLDEYGRTIALSRAALSRDEERKPEELI